MSVNYPQRTYRAALVGCGGMGRTHARALASLPGVKLVALADIDPARLASFGAEFGVSMSHRHLDFAQMLDRERPDFVVVSTQAPQHAPVTLAAAERGIHVLCEKPLALNLAEVDAMVAACQQAGVVLAVNHLRRSAPAAQMARDLIAAGEIGDVVALDIHDKGGRPVGNTLMEMATHYFDMARFLLSHRTLAGGRTGDSVEWVYAHLSTGVGAVAHPATPQEIVPSRVAKPTDRDCGLVLGERGTVVIGLAGEVQAVARFHNFPATDARYDGTDVIGTKGSLAVRGGMAVSLFRRKGHAFAEHDPWLPVPVADDADGGEPGVVRCRDMVQEMMAAIAEGRQHVSSGQDGLAVLEIIMAVYASHQQGAPVALPLPDRRHPLEVWQADASVAV